MNRVSDFVKVIKAIKEVAPESNVVVWKSIPIGNQKLDIERNVFNASIVKKLSEDSEVNLSFLDHGNLAEQALPIKDYYKQDLVHLAPDGIDVFSTNLRRIINEVLKKNVSPDDNNQRKDINISSNFSGRRNVYQYRDDNRDSNRKGSIYKNRITGFAKTINTGNIIGTGTSETVISTHVLGVTTAIHIDANIGATTRTLVIAIRILGVTLTIHTGTMKGDNTRPQVIARLLGIAMTINYWSLIGILTRTKVITR